jgi:hypothetical protein
VDPSTVAAAVVSIVSPFLQGFLRGAKGAAEGAGEAAGGKLRNLATALWGRLHPRVQEKPAAIEASEEVAEHPEDTDAQAALRVQLRKLFEQDLPLLKDIAGSLEQAQQSGVIADVVIYGGVTASGPDSIAVGKVGGGINKGVVPESKK